MNQSSNAALTISDRETRLPRPTGVDSATWRILCEVIFPAVREPHSILMAVDYCVKRKLDILKRPVNIVPMWNSALRKEVDTIWPSINEIQITAARSKEWAGMDAARLGPMIERTFAGTRKDKSGSYVDAKQTLIYPEWAQVTVYRITQGLRCQFVGDPVYWLEAYGRSGGSTLPNAMWTKRPIGQLVKVAKAAALRSAFPEEDASPTDVEMAGGVIDEEALSENEVVTRPKIAEVKPAAETIDAETGEVTSSPQLPEEMPKADSEDWRAWGERFIAAVRGCSDSELVETWQRLNQKHLDEMQKTNAKLHSTLLHGLNKHKLTLPGD